MNIDELPIANVSYRKRKMSKDEFVITFKINGFKYILHTNKMNDGVIRPVYIDHRGESLRSKGCKYCETNEMECLVLTKRKEDLFHILIEHPAIRLDWLYIKHV